MAAGSVTTTPARWVESRRVHCPTLLGNSFLFVFFFLAFLFCFDTLNMHDYYTCCFVLPSSRGQSELDIGVAGRQRSRPHSHWHAASGNHQGQQRSLREIGAELARRSHSHWGLDSSRRCVWGQVAAVLAKRRVCAAYYCLRWLHRPQSGAAGKTVVAGQLPALASQTAIDSAR